jgi:hypothetical protein
MKKFFIASCLTLFISPTFAAIKCERDFRGNLCCWDTAVEGPFKPISCM